MKRIAIVEDNKTTREGLRTIIGLSGEFECAGVCETGEEALKVLPRLQPSVVLMDIQLPGMSGIECVGKLKRLCPEMQVIMITVYADPDRIFSALRAGASGYILKRSSPDEVVAAIREVSGGGAPMSGEIARKVIQYFKAQTDDETHVGKLTAREREILDLVAHGMSNKDIAARLFVTVDAVRWHLKHIYAKLHVHSRTEAALKFRGNR